MRGAKVGKVTVTTRPLAEITQEAIGVLCREMGIVNTLRFVNQFTVGYGNYTEEREALFGEMSLDEIIAEIKRTRGEKVSNSR
jgi:hypothetical protein